MPLPSFLQRLRQRSAPSVADASPLSSADIEVARVRARRRLVGMVVLVGVGVVGLPWLFETQPRPLGPDVQVVSAVYSRGNGAEASSRPVPAIASVTVPVPEEAVESARDEVEAPVASQPVALASASAAQAPVSKPVPARAKASQSVATKQASAKEMVKKEPAKPVVAAENVATKDAARAKSLLEGKPPVVKPAAVPSDAAATRYVVQIGAFSDAPTAREVRLKAERAGIKTYTQEVTVNGGKKIRVRVGPYANKPEADKAVDTLRKAGMTGALLTL